MSDDGYTHVHIAWGDVVEVTLHKLDELASDRRGDIFTVRMKEVPNFEMMRNSSIRICQMLTIMIDDRFTIHALGKEGEQNWSWVQTDHTSRTVASCTVRDKYWGDKNIHDLRVLVRVMAKIHGWKLVDETVSVLDRIVLAIDGPAESSNEQVK